MLASPATYCDPAVERHNMFPADIRVSLTKGMFALVDASHAHFVTPHKWCASKTDKHFYAMRREARISGGKLIAMHRLIAGAAEGQIVDHINGDTLDNRSHNLRIVTTAQNNMNKISSGGTSRYKGVSWFKTRNKWVVRIRDGERYRCLGYFNDEIQAASAYDAVAIRIFGEFAVLNLGSATGRTACAPEGQEFRTKSLKAIADRIALEQAAWNRTPTCMRRWREGFPAVVVLRGDAPEAVKLGDLTSRELDRMLSVPALEMGCR